MHTITTCCKDWCSKKDTKRYATELFLAHCFLAEQAEIYFCFGFFWHLIFHFSEILHEAEELWNRQGSDTSSEAGSSSTGGSDISDTISQRSHRSALAQAMAKQQALAVHGGKFLNNIPIKKSFLHEIQL